MDSIPAKSIAASRRIELLCGFVRANRNRSRATRGLGLVEAMNFATLALVIAAIAVAGVARYMRHARAAEAIGSVSAMGTGCVAAYDRSDANDPSSGGHASRRFPTSANATIPSDRTTVSGRRYQSASYEWDAVPWRDLKFSMSQVQSYAYDFKSEGTGANASAKAIAEGDLDGDKEFSNYTLRILPDTSLSARVSSQIDIENGDE